MAVLLVGLMSLGFFAPVSAHAFQIDGVHVSPPDPIHPGDPVSLEIMIRTPTTPAFLTQPTDVEVVGNSIFVDVHASAGHLRAIDELTEVVDLGRFSPGTYTYTVTLIPAFDTHFGREMRVATGRFTILRRSANEGVCDKLLDATPGLYGLCVAFCEAPDLPPDSRLMDIYERIRRDDDPDMPCLVDEIGSISGVCPCWSREELESIAPNPETDSWTQGCGTGDDVDFDIDSIFRVGGPRTHREHLARAGNCVFPLELTGSCQPLLECTYFQQLVPGLPNLLRQFAPLTQEEYGICRDQIRARQIELGIADACEIN